jgi:glycosyltransferase involved in cell wall biosynthesis
MEKKRILFIGGGPIMPLTSPLSKMKHELMSRYFSGDIITNVTNEKHLSVKMIGDFNFHPYVAYKGNFFFRNIQNWYNFFIKALLIYYFGKPYDVVVASNPLMNGFIAMLVGKITGAKVIVEVNGNFEDAFKYGHGESEKPGLTERIKERISMMIIPFIIKHVDAAKLLYDSQLNIFKINKKKKNITMSFPDIVPTKVFIDNEKSDGKYILLLGYPWFLKGVDILIQAFNKISDDFPEYRLKIVGWCPEGKEQYYKLAQGNKKIELCDPVPYAEVVELMSNCSLYVLASRTEAMGRVLIEAMACKKPIIASNVGGVPFIVKDGFNGLLFENENIDELAEKIRLLFSNPELGGKLAENGFNYAGRSLSEESYLNNYKQLIDKCLMVE